MSLRMLGKPDSPPVLVNGVPASGQVVKGKPDGLPDFDLENLVDLAARPRSTPILETEPPPKKSSSRKK